MGQNETLNCRIKQLPCNQALQCNVMQHIPYSSKKQNPTFVKFPISFSLSFQCHVIHCIIWDGCYRWDRFKCLQFEVLMSWTSEDRKISHVRVKIICIDNIALYRLNLGFSYIEQWALGEVRHPYMLCLANYDLDDDINASYKSNK